MEDVETRIVEKVQVLSDIELAVLLCLITQQHCIIETEHQTLEPLVQEIKLIASNVFGLTSAVLDCSEATTLDDFGTGILVNHEEDDYFSSKKSAAKSEFSNSTNDYGRRTSKSPRPFTPLDSRRIANIVIAKSLNKATSQVQVQALELMRGKRNYTRTAVHAAPKPFLFIALNARGTGRLTTHLNDQFLISHKHQQGDELANLEDSQEKEPISADDASLSSVVRSPPEGFEKRAGPIVFTPDDLGNLIALVGKVRISAEVRAYLHSIVVFMRLHRAVAGGISAMATRHFTTLSHALAPLHGLDYITPSLVALAARKIYPHRIIITAPENERSMQWGSSLEAVKTVLEGVTEEAVVEEVLQSVEVPL
ncbi:hypothetical protein CC80DRAFT_515406 [Byssothecium circinans]|uniref:magnesium chelatase n=1 Tax=Byssothecium circinans TaxID=147558 RepID=A0A6A5U0U5_9PLEO|nr:hypothetical protein CC80DRAFT_515406 [Byssothecium circinans]